MDFQGPQARYAHKPHEGGLTFMALLSSPTIFCSEYLMALQEEECFLDLEQGAMEAEAVMSPSGSPVQEPCLHWNPAGPSVLDTTTSIQGLLVFSNGSPQHGSHGAHDVNGQSWTPGWVPTVGWPVLHPTRARARPLAYHQIHPALFSGQKNLL